MREQKSSENAISALEALIIGFEKIDRYPQIVADSKYIMGLISQSRTLNNFLIEISFPNTYSIQEFITLPSILNRIYEFYSKHNVGSLASEAEKIKNNIVLEIGKYKRQMEEGASMLCNASSNAMKHIENHAIDNAGVNFEYLNSLAVSLISHPIKEIQDYGQKFAKIIENLSNQAIFPGKTENQDKRAFVFAYVSINQLQNYTLVSHSLKLEKKEITITDLIKTISDKALIFDKLDECMIKVCNDFKEIFYCAKKISNPDSVVVSYDNEARQINLWCSREMLGNSFYFSVIDAICSNYGLSMHYAGGKNSRDSSYGCIAIKIDPIISTKGTI